MRTRAQRLAEYGKRMEAKAGYLSMFECADCGTRERLQMDHREDTTKLFNPADVSHRSWRALWTEWAKCDVRCVSCHARRHILARMRTAA